MCPLLLDREPGRLPSMGSQRVRYDWAISLTSYFNHWRRKWQPTPVFLPGESLGPRNLVGHGPWATESRIRLKWLSMPCYWRVTASRLPRQTEETGVRTTQACVPHTCVPSVSVHLLWDCWFQSQHHRISCSLLHSSIFVTPFSGCEKPGLIIIIQYIYSFVQS